MYRVYAISLALNCTVSSDKSFIDDKYHVGKYCYQLFFIQCRKEQSVKEDNDFEK